MNVEEYATRLARTIDRMCKYQGYDMDEVDWYTFIEFLIKEYNNGVMYKNAVYAYRKFTYNQISRIMHCHAPQNIRDEYLSRLD